MKIVHVATTDLGGAYKAVERIHQALLLNGVESKILLRTKCHANSIGDEVIKRPFQKLISKTKNLMNLFASNGDFVSDCFGTDLSRYPDVIEADIIVLHWINSFISDKQVHKLVKLNKPIVWVAHDMWNCTGGCHCDDYCGRFAIKCGKCPLLNSVVENDKSRKNFLKKEYLYENIILVGPSKWSADQAKSSPIWNNHRIEWIYNPINTDVFCPAEGKKEAQEKKIILFGAAKALSNSTKGAQDISTILQGFSGEEYQLVVFGNSPEQKIDNCPIPTTYLGYVESEERMVEIYRSASVFLAPSKQESFCYTVAEALSCGTPVVGYAVGGIAEQVDHKVNGYLAELGDMNSLAEGIRYCCSHEMNILDHHNSLEESGFRYKTLFEELLCKK